MAATVKFISLEWRETVWRKGREEIMLKYSWSRIPLSAVFDEIQLHQQFTEYFHNEYRCSDCKDAVDTRRQV